MADAKTDCFTFQKNQSVISRHINNIFKDNEVEEKSNMQKMHIANSDKPVKFYSLKQYNNLTIEIADRYHDRFLLIDDTEAYHIGASLKDLGRRVFAFSKIDIELIQRNNT